MEFIDEIKKTFSKYQAKKEREDFYGKIAKQAEGFHGSTSIATHDAREKHITESNRSRDIGYGHKLTSKERKSGLIYGIPHKEGIDEEQALEIFSKDMGYHTNLARQDGMHDTDNDGKGDKPYKGWDSKLKSLGMGWDDLDTEWQLPLESLSYNVGGYKAGSQWTNVFKAVQTKDVQGFAAGLRRQDNGKNTTGMDNRVLKEMYFSGLIESASEVMDVLPLADPELAGIPL
ncbi:MAG: hypothetical protein NZ730_09040 [Porticoccaceae bacterium]|nr:hypothetical protein [Porticoccaceae bacterium]